MYPRLLFKKVIFMCACVGLALLIYQCKLAYRINRGRAFSHRIPHTHSFLDVVRFYVNMKSRENTTLPEEKPTCRESNITSFQRLHRAEFRNLSYVFQPNVDADRVYKYAICEFQMMDAYNFHFPHTMQQLYRCWSWWRLCNNSHPILSFPRSSIPDNEFLQGFVNALQGAINLTVLKPNEASMLVDATVAKPRTPHNLVDPKDIFGMQDQTKPYYAMHQRDDAKILREVISTQLMIPESKKEHFGSTSLDKDMPRIAILNRHVQREWVNAELLTADFEGHGFAGNIPITYFDSDTSFADQINFFLSTDILLSPHGAQLTGIAFMPDCGSVLEIFPRGYYLPQYFGSLAQAACLGHGSLSVTDTGDWESESKQGMRSQQDRGAVRNTAICPNVTSVTTALRQLVSEWQECTQN